MRQADPIEIALAKETDVAALLRLARKEAEYERLTDHFAATEERLRTALFGPRPAAEAVLARAGDEPVALAIFFTTFSTFAARSGLYLEDLFVEQPWRGRGVGRKLLAYVAEIAVHRGCHALNWSVLRWNEPAIAFYRHAGAEQLEAWSHFQLAGRALNDLAREAR